MSAAAPPAEGLQWPGRGRRAAGAGLAGLVVRLQTIVRGVLIALGAWFLGASLLVAWQAVAPDSRLNSILPAPTA